MVNKAYRNCKISIESHRFEQIKRIIDADFTKLKVLQIEVETGALAALIQAGSLEYQGTEAVQDFYQKLCETDSVLSGKVTPALFPESRFKDHFDLVIAIDVLQFVENPLDFIEELAGFLKEGGRIYLEVPNEALIFLRATIRRVFGLYSGFPVHPGHNYFFTRRTLTYLLRKSSLEIASMSQVSIANDQARLLGTIERTSPLLLGFISRLLRITRLDLLFQMGNLVCVVKKSAS